MYNLEEMYVDILDTITKMYNLEEMHVDILGTRTKNVQSRRDACRYTEHNNEKCTI